jgi:hypothetical protein
MNRREFVRTSMVLSGAAVLGASTFAQQQEAAVAASLRLDPKQRGHRIPVDFTGLSYEKAQMSDPAYFSGANTALVGMMRRLGPKGVLRIGGNTSEYCFWTPHATPGTSRRPTGILRGWQFATCGSSSMRPGGR